MPSLHCFVTGCAGFIGSNLTDRLLSSGHTVVGYDNFSTGQRRFLSGARESPNFRMVHADVLDSDALAASIKGADIAFHFAANADVRFGADHPRLDLEQNTMGTYNVLQAMRDTGVGRIVFASSGSVYGESRVIPTPEDAPFPAQTSFYGASKAAAEGLITAFCAAFGIQAYIFRLVSALGERYTHGHILDFYRQLRKDPGVLRVLGGGKQRKSYLFVRDGIEAMLLAIEKSDSRVNIFNLGHETYCEVNDSIAWICQALGLQPRIEYGYGDRGWVGDNPFLFLDSRKIRALGWTPSLTIRQGVLRTVEYLSDNPWVLEARP